MPPSGRAIDRPDAQRGPANREDAVGEEAFGRRAMKDGASMGETEVERALFAAAWAAHARAHAPYSHFSVGAALETEEGEIVSGCNVENVSLGLGVCAERVALFACLARGLTPGRRIAIVTGAPSPTPPCGACRQVLRELAPRTSVLSRCATGEQRSWRPEAMLPGPLSPARAHDWEPRDIIARKRDGRELDEEEIRRFVHGLLTGEVEEHQMSAWMMAVYLRGMSRREIRDLTRAMAESGTRLDYSGIPGPKVDKHSTGGVGDKISLPLVPLAMAGGLRVPMISGRGLGHTGGTLDKLEAIPGYRALLSTERLRELIESPGAFIAGQTADLVPADRLMYALRDVSGTVASVPLIVASILSKKISAGLDGLVLDVKFGRGAFMRDEREALDLARVLVEVSASLGLSAAALLTRMDEPIGFAVGHALEVRECFSFLSRDERPGAGEAGAHSADVEELTLALGGAMVALGGLAPTMRAGAALLRARLEDGSAREACRRWIAAQGGDPALVDRPEDLQVSANRRVVRSPASGFVRAIDALQAGRLCVRLGGGRRRRGEPIDLGVGIVFHRKTGDRVAAGDPLCTLYLPAGESADEALSGEREMFTIASDPPVPSPRIAALVLPEGTFAEPWDTPIAQGLKR